MSLDLYSKESLERLSGFRPVSEAEPGAFDGTGDIVMQTFAKAGRAASMAYAGVVELAGEATEALTQVGKKTSLADSMPDFNEQTKRQVTDIYFGKVHEGVFQNAVESWTPNPNDVGKAAEVVGPLLSMIPMVVAAPSLAVAETQLAVGEDLVRQGVDPDKAQAVGAVQGAGLGLGIWMPILGNNLWQRVFVGGAGFNLVQGAAMRGVSGEILEGTPAEDNFKAFDGTALTLDVMLGMAFGGLSHLSPSQRAQGVKAWENIAEWTQALKPSQVDALITLRQSQHLNVDSTPGTPAGIPDVEKHTQRLRKAVDQILNDKPVDVESMPAPKVEADGRFVEAEQRGKFLLEESNRIRQEEGIQDAVRVSDGPADQSAVTTPPPRGDEVPAGPEVIPRADNLSDADRAVESRFADYISKSTDDAIARYKKEFGNVLNTDNARELSSDYAASKESRSMLSPAVNEPASWLVKEMYRQELAKQAPEGKENLVVFTAGGTGSGKSTAINKAGAGMIDKAQIVYDTNMNGLESSVAKIDQALDAGKQVRIIYVHRDPVDALVKGALPRAERMGRTVPLKAHADTHRGSAEAVQLIAEKYKDNPNVKVIVLDNTGGKSDVSLGSLETIKRTDYNDLEGRLQKALNEEYQNARITQAVYEGTSGPAGGLRQEARAGTDRQPETKYRPGREGRSGAQRGSEEKRVSPVVLAAEKLAAEQPQLEITVGQAADGTPIRKTIRQYLDDAKEATARAREDSKLFEVAAACIMGIN